MEKMEYRQMVKKITVADIEISQWTEKRQAEIEQKKKYLWKYTEGMRGKHSKWNKVSLSKENRNSKKVRYDVAKASKYCEEWYA